MRKILTFITVDSFFANAGQSATERANLQGLAQSGRYTIRAVCMADRADRSRFEEYCRKELPQGSLEYVAFPWTDAAVLLSGVSAILLHSLPNLHLTKALLHDRIWLSRPTLHFVHSFAATYLERFIWAAFWGHWGGSLPSRILSPSHSTAHRVRGIQSLVRSLGGELPEIVIVPPGIDVDACASGNRERGRSLLGCQPGDRIILCLARLTPNKVDHQQLIEVVALLNSRLRSTGTLQLVFAGGVAPDEEEYVHQLQSLGRNRKVNLTILSHVNEEVKRDLLSVADVFVSPAAHPQESFGLALVEAMAAGVAVVASDWNGYREVLPPVYKTYLVPTIADELVAHNVGGDLLARASIVDFTALVNVMELLLSKEELRMQLAQEGRKQAHNFRIEDATDKVISILDDLIATQPRRTSLSASDFPQLSTPVSGLASGYLSENSTIRRGLRDDCTVVANTFLLQEIRQRDEISLASLTPLFDGDRFLRNLVVLSLARYGFLQISNL